MKQSSKDKGKGKFHEATGKVKEKVGRATNNFGLEAEGQVEKIGGKVQKKIGKWRKPSDNKQLRLRLPRVGAVSNFLARNRRQFTTPGLRGLGRHREAPTLGVYTEKVKKGFR